MSLKDARWGRLMTAGFRFPLDEKRGSRQMAAIVVCAACTPTQPTSDDEMRQFQGRQSLPEEGAPLARRGPYEVIVEPAEVVVEPTFGSTEYLVYRPASLDAFPNEDTLPIVVWGNGGCGAWGDAYTGFLSTLASYGFLVVTAARHREFSAMDLGPGLARVTKADLAAGLDWAEAEVSREGSPLYGKIDTESVAVMGQSCGGMLAIALASDPRVDTIGVWNAGVGNTDEYSRWATQTDREAVRVPVLYITGGDGDHLMPAAEADYEAIDTAPVFYGARRNGGHMGTMLPSWRRRVR
jgi:dipeptidyl aminopeptidase/acylaminoacyl peptidase